MLPLTDRDLLEARFESRVRGKLFAHRTAPAGLRVAVRLNLNNKVRKGGQTFAIQTIHGKPSPRAHALGYDLAVTLTEAVFHIDQEGRQRIAEGAHKFPMAAVVGNLCHDAADLTGVEIRFNPKTTRYFQRVDDGRPVATAEIVTIFNTRVYARGSLTYIGGDHEA